MNHEKTSANRVIGISLAVFVSFFILLTPSKTRADTALPIVTVYKSPTCGCCGKWIEHLQSNGFVVDAQNRNDLDSIKRELGIEPRFQACHTARIGNYVVEGHVPGSRY